MDFESSPHKQTAIKYVDTSIRLSPYRQFCCPVSLISVSPSAYIPVSPRFFGEFDVDAYPPLKNGSVPVLQSSPKTPKTDWVGPLCQVMVTGSQADCTTNIRIRKVVVQRIRTCNSNLVLSGDWKKLFALTS